MGATNPEMYIEGKNHTGFKATLLNTAGTVLKAIRQIGTTPCINRFLGNEGQITPTRNNIEKQQPTLFGVPIGPNILSRIIGSNCLDLPGIVNYIALDPERQREYLMERIEIWSDVVFNTIGGRHVLRLQDELDEVVIERLGAQNLVLDRKKERIQGLSLSGYGVIIIQRLLNDLLAKTNSPELPQLKHLEKFLVQVQVKTADSITLAEVRALIFLDNWAKNHPTLSTLPSHTPLQ